MVLERTSRGTITNYIIFINASFVGRRKLLARETGSSGWSGFSGLFGSSGLSGWSGSTEQTRQTRQTKWTRQTGELFQAPAWQANAW